MDAATDTHRPQSEARVQLYEGTNEGQAGPRAGLHMTPPRTTICQFYVFTDCVFVSLYDVDVDV